jgi:transposase InsO family protein
MSPDDTRKKIEIWKQDYNHVRPHPFLDDTTPALFASQVYESQPSRIL